MTLARLKVVPACHGPPWPQPLTAPLCGEQAVLITDPELAREVLHSPHLDKFRYLYSFLDPFLGGTNLLTGHTDAHWKAVRKGVAPAFSAGNMRCARGVHARWAAGAALLWHAGSMATLVNSILLFCTVV